MRIVDRKELMRLPAGTLYNLWERSVFYALFIKGETIRSREGDADVDWWATELPEIEAHDVAEMMSRQAEMAEKGASYPVDLDVEGRAAMYGDGPGFAVWEVDDVRRLHAKLGRYLERADEAARKAGA